MPDRCRPGSAAIASSTRRNRAARTSILAASKTSVRNSPPTDPGRLPGLGEPFSELERQIPTSSLDISVQRRDLHITQRHRSRGITTILGEVLPPQRHLEQRMMSQRPGGVEPLDQAPQRAHPDARKPPNYGPDPRQHLGHRGIPTQIHPQHQRVDEEPHQIIQNRIRTPAIGKPTATSEVPPSLPNNTANAACTTMKAVALYCRANPAINSCTSTGHSTATAAPR